MVQYHVFVVWNRRMCRKNGDVELCRELEQRAVIPLCFPQTLFFGQLGLSHRSYFLGIPYVPRDVEIFL